MPATQCISTDNNNVVRNDVCWATTSTPSQWFARNVISFVEYIHENGTQNIPTRGKKCCWNCWTNSLNHWVDVLMRPLRLQTMNWNVTNSQTTFVSCEFICNSKSTRFQFGVSFSLFNVGLIPSVRLQSSFVVVAWTERKFMNRLNEWRTMKAETVWVCVTWDANRVSLPQPQISFSVYRLSAAAAATHRNSSIATQRHLRFNRIGLLCACSWMYDEDNDNDTVDTLHYSVFALCLAMQITFIARSP